MAEKKIVYNKQYDNGNIYTGFLNQNGAYNGDQGILKDRYGSYFIGNFENGKLLTGIAHLRLGQITDTYNQDREEREQRVRNFLSNIDSKYSTQIQALFDTEHYKIMEWKMPSNTFMKVKGWFKTHENENMGPLKPTDKFMKIDLSDLKTISENSGEVVNTQIDAAKRQINREIATGTYTTDVTYPDGRREEVSPGQKLGKITFKNGDVYEGIVNNGYGDDEKGKITYIEGHVFKGLVKSSDAKNGIINYPNGDKYEGEVSNGKPHGKGVFTYNNGDVYDGEMAKGLARGEGEYRFQNGDIYQGHMSQGKPNGKGIIEYKSRYNHTKKNYEGLVANGVPNGEGKLTYENGNVFEGLMEKGEPKGRLEKGETNGTGKLIYKNGDIYEGPLENGVEPIGKGTLIFKETEDIFKGEFKNGKPANTGTYIYKNGDTYEGSMLNGVPNGEGTLTTFKDKGTVGNLFGKLKTDFNKGDKLILKFVNGKPVKEGKLLYLNGDVYEGALENNVPNGKGKLTYKETGNTFEGEFINGTPAKTGKLTYKDTGNTFEGPMENNIPNGKGKLTYKGTGNTFEGEFINGSPAKTGKLLYKNEDVYEGPMENNVPKGKGKLTYKETGNTFEGEFIDGSPAETGKLLYLNGDVYEGPMKNGLPNGKGKITYNNGGDKFEGFFIDGKSKFFDFFITVAKLNLKDTSDIKKLFLGDENNNENDAITKKKIKAKYRRMSLLFHNDKNMNEEENAKRAQEIINNALGTLYPKTLHNTEKEEETPNEEQQNEKQQNEEQKKEEQKKEETTEQNNGQQTEQNNGQQTDQNSGEHQEKKDNKTTTTTNQGSSTGLFTKAALGIGAAGLLYYGYKKLRKSSKKKSKSELQSESHEEPSRRSARIRESGRNRRSGRSGRSRRSGRSSRSGRSGTRRKGEYWKK